MAELNHKLRPNETVQKILISTTSRMVGEYENEDILITHALASVSDLPARILETPLSRSGYIIAFERPPIQEPSIIIPNYTPTGERICAYMSVLFGKRFDCHGLVETNGSYQIPDLTVYNRTCNQELPFNSHKKRNCFPVPLKIDQVSSIERVLTGTETGPKLQSRLDAICKFYMLALQSAENNPEVAYLHLITAGEILSRFFKYPKEDMLDEKIIADLNTIRDEIKDGDKIAKRISRHFMAVKKRFVKSLYSLLDDSFYTTAESKQGFGHFKPENIEGNIGAAYDLRSKYVHTGMSFGRAIESSRDYNDLWPGKPLVDDKKFAKILEKAPKLAGLERLMRYCILKFMLSRKLFICPEME